MRNLLVLSIICICLLIEIDGISTAEVSITANVFPKYIAKGDTPFSVHFTVTGLDSSKTYEFWVRVRRDSTYYGSFWGTRDGDTGWGATYAFLCSGVTQFSTWAYVRARDTISTGSGAKIRIAVRVAGTTTYTAIIVPEDPGITVMDMSSGGDGAWVEATAAVAAAGKAILAFDSSDNIIGTYAIEDNGVDEGYTPGPGYFKIAVPAGSSIAKLEARNSDNTIFATQSGSWTIGSAGSTTNLDGQIDVSLPVVFSSLVASEKDRKIILRWSTESEGEIVGWNVYRESKGKWVKINPKLIPSKGEMGGRYEFIDPNPDNPSRYMIEWVNLKGEKRRSKPITLSRSGKLKAATWAEVKTR